MKAKSVALGLVLLATIAAGCDSGITSDAQPIVSVLKHDGVCYALIAGAKVDPSLGVPDVCNYRSDVRVYAGIDKLEIIVDYGPDVPFSRSEASPRPDVVVTVDGVTSTEPIEISDEIRVGSRAYYVATLRAPSQSSAEVRISAGVNAGFQTFVSESLTTIAPPVSLTLLECSQGSLCELPGGVGSAHISLLVTGGAEQQVRIMSRLDNVPQPDPIPPVKTFVVGNNSEAITGLPIPPAPDGTTWTIRAQLGDSAPAMVSVSIRAPELFTSLTCGTSCVLSSGDRVGLEIIAPSEIQTLEARVTTRLDGVPLLVNAVVPLDKRADGTAVGLLGLVAPVGAGSWQIDTIIAGYAAPAIVAVVN
jgi:hypothetical protein